MRITSNHLVRELYNLNELLSRPVDYNNSVGNRNIGHLILSACNGKYFLKEVISASGGEKSLSSGLTAREMDICISSMLLVHTLIGK